MSELSATVGIGKAALLHLAAYLGALRTYAPNNAVVINSQRLLMDTLGGRRPGDSLRIQLLDNASFANDQLLNLTVSEFERSAELTRLLRDHDVGEVVFGPGVQLDDLQALARAVSEVLHGQAAVLPPTVGPIELRPLHATAMNTSVESHRLALWLVSGLNYGIDALQEAHDGGEEPNMSAFMQHLRLTADLMEDHPHVFQLLTANRSQLIVDGDPIHSSLRTVEALGVGTALGLSKNALLVLGLASILDQVTANQGPDFAVEMAAGLGTLGDLTPSVMLTLWDLEVIRTGGRGGKLALILEVADQYVRLTHKQSKERDVDEFWQQLTRTVPSARSIINVFRHWKGNIPMGAIVRHPDHGQCVVMDQSGHDGTCRLAPFSEWGVLDDPVEVGHLELEASYLGPIHALCLPESDDARRIDRNGEPPFLLPETYLRTQLRVGDRFGGRRGDRIEVLRLAGRGAQATVFHGRDRRLDRDIAVKLARVSGAQALSKMLGRFETELQLSSKVSHAHVLQVYDCGELEGGTPYVVLEWMEHGDLGRLLDAAWQAGLQLPIHYVHYYALSVASAMRAVHAAGIIHRDIKPGNVLIRGDGVAKITDFGIARVLVGDGSAHTETGQTVGTLGYMAPEHLMGLPGPQSDVFSFGVMLFQLLASSMPQQDQRNGRPSGRIKPEEWNLIPPAWRDAVRAMTAPDLEHRLLDFGAVIDAIRAVPLAEDRQRDLMPAERLPVLPSRDSISFLDGVGSGSVTADVPISGENETVFIDDL